MATLSFPSPSLSEPSTSTTPTTTTPVPTLTTSSSSTTSPVTSTTPTSTTSPTATTAIPSSSGTSPSSSSSATTPTTSTLATSTSTSQSTSTSSSTTSPSTVLPTLTPPSVAGPINTVTQTAIVTGTNSQSTSSSSSAANNTTNSSSFFSNTGAVAGVFTVVGLVVLVIVIALITNTIRRRRAKRFDDDVAQAAAEAAASAHAPMFLDDPEDDRTYHSLPGGGTVGYSDNSHGTYGQPPMHETYGMSEMQPHQPYDVYQTGSGVAGAAGVGAVMQRAKSLRGMQEQNTHPGMAGYDASAPMIPVPGIGERQTPYPAFAGSGAYDTRYRPAPGNPDFDLLEAAGLSAAAGGAAAAHSGPSHQADGSGVSRNISQGTRDTRSPPTDGYFSSTTTASTHTQPTSVSPGPAASAESYAAHYAPGFQKDANRVAEEDAYVGYTDERQAGAGMNPFSTPVPGGDASGSDYSEQEEVPPAFANHVVGGEESRMSFRDEEDYEAERSKRILKIANQ